MTEALANIPTWLSSAMVVTGSVILMLAGWRLVRKSRRARQQAAEWNELYAVRERYARQELAERAEDLGLPTRTVPLPRPEAHPALIEQLDNKIAALQRVIHEADARIAKLQRLGVTVDAPAATTDAEPVDDAVAEVYRLADLGYDATAIAERTGQHPGQVELLLAIRR
jgi:hypothetical protein